jgi:hypothetical protein
LRAAQIFDAPQANIFARLLRCDLMFADQMAGTVPNVGQDAGADIADHLHHLYWKVSFRLASTFGFAKVIGGRKDVAQRRFGGFMDRISLYDIARSHVSDDPITKELGYYRMYDEYFWKHGFVPRGIVEVGVYQGESTKILAKAYPNAKILALDLIIRDIDFSECPNVTYLQADQSKPKEMADLVGQHFPDGVDLIVEDASHIGALATRRSTPFSLI